MTVGMIICAVALILGLWMLAFEVSRVGNALWQMQADLHDIRCSIYVVGEPAHKVLKAQLNKQAAATPDWQSEIHATPNPFSD